MKADIDNLTRMLENKEKDLGLSQRESKSLKEDNERISRMYQLVQKEAFNNVERLKKHVVTETSGNNEFVGGNSTLAAPQAKKSLWRAADDGLGRGEMSTLSAGNRTTEMYGNKDHSVTMKRDYI